MEKEKSLELIERRKKAVPNGISMNFDLTVERAEGAFIYDADGNQLIDFAGGSGAVISGHCPPEIVRAIKEQSEKLLHANFQLGTYESYLNLSEYLCSLIPHGEHTKAMLCTNGAEAVENAIKIARQSTKRRAVLCYTGAYHGRTNLAMALSSKISYKKNCGPFSPEIYRIQYPNYYRYGDMLSPEQFAQREIARLREAMQNIVNEENLAAIIIEIVQGDGGGYIAPRPYIEALRGLCNEKGIVLIFDEVQTGLGRCGKYAAFQHYEVEPDISTYAKALGAGMPIGAVLGKAEIMDAAAAGTLGGTFDGNPLSCAASLANLHLLEELSANQLAEDIGLQIEDRLADIQKKCKSIGDVRRMGALVSVELVKDGNPRKPDSDLCNKLMKTCYDRGLVLSKAGTFNNIFRIMCPLTIDSETLLNGMRIIEEELLLLEQNQ